MALIRKALFPVAGLGTRSLPATNAMPEELLPIIDKLIARSAVEEALEALEAEVSRPAIHNCVGDVSATGADAALRQNLNGYRPKTDFCKGTAQFVRWYKAYYSV